jgi:hypothetical protein
MVQTASAADANWTGDGKRQAINQISWSRETLNSRAGRHSSRSSRRPSIAVEGGGVVGVVAGQVRIALGQDVGKVGKAFPGRAR